MCCVLIAAQRGNLTKIPRNCFVFSVVLSDPFTDVSAEYLAADNLRGEPNFCSRISVRNVVFILIFFKESSSWLISHSHSASESKGI